MADFTHVLESQQFTRAWLEDFFPLARAMKSVPSLADNGVPCTDLAGKRMCTLFYEPSTRTRASFESAMWLLGGVVSFSTENAREFSSAIKGESLEDTIRILNGYHPHVIVLRYHEEGGAERAARVSNVPIINAGDGTGQHPTQALLDIFTIHEELGSIAGISIALVGDLDKGRTVRSLAYLLGRFQDIHISLVSPPSLRMRDDIKYYLGSHGVRFAEHTDLREVAPNVDVIYQTRAQTERGSRQDLENDSAFCVINQGILDVMQKNAIIMHPMPIDNEIRDREVVDKDPRVVYFRQAENGLYVRMALLKRVLTD